MKCHRCECREIGIPCGLAHDATCLTREAARCGAMHPTVTGRVVCDLERYHDGPHGNGYTGATTATGYGPLTWSAAP